MLRPVAPMLEYVVYEDYIAEFLCINKEKTELNCNGKCYLMQRLAEQDEQKKENLPKILLEEYPIGFVQLVSLPTTKILSNYILIPNNYFNHYDFIFSNFNFRPPSVKV